MRYASVCDGIGAVHVGWRDLGWTCAWTSEIEPFPIAVVDHHWKLPNLGDMTKITEDQLAQHGRIDLLVGGTPCQSFSVAGLRGGLDDPRGNLALRFLQLAGVLRPRWLVFENVPGLLSSNGGRDFGAFLGGLGKLGYGWSYRVLDAQFFGVAQRRRRVFVVGCLGEWRGAAAVLFERNCLSGNPPPSREAGKGVAALTAHGVGTCGADDNQAQAGHLVAYGGGNVRGERSIATALTHHAGRLDFDSETFIAHSLRAEGFDASEDGTGRGTPIVPVAFNWQGGGTQTSLGYDPASRVTGAIQASQIPAVAFDCKGTDCQPGQITPTMRAMHHAGSHANAGGQLAVAFSERTRGDGSVLEFETDPVMPAVRTGVQRQQGVWVRRGVRRLTPRECERLQGFPDHFTLVTYRGKPAADGNRYRALGNSMAVPVMSWIGERIARVDSILEVKDSA